MNKYLSISLIMVALILGIGFGYGLAPEYTREMNSRKLNMELGAADKTLDLRYLNNVIAHHKNAIFMAEQVKQKSTRPELKSLAEAIISSDTKSISELMALRKDWYGQINQITQFERIQLGENDAQFDLRFLNALIGHHIEAIDSAKELRTKSKRSETLNIADGIITSLSKSLDELKTWRKEWFQI